MMVSFLTGRLPYPRSWFWKLPLRQLNAIYRRESDKKQLEIESYKAKKEAAAYESRFMVDEFRTQYTRADNGEWEEMI